jgi:phage regulator Rha-like protein
MKKIILLVLVFVTVNKWSNAQCNKKILWTSTKEEFLDANGQVTHTDEDSVTLEVSDSGITINHNNIPQDELKGTIKEINCNWSEPFKTGKTTFKSDLTEVRGDEHNGNFTIEGKDGQISVLMELTDKGGMKIKLYVNRYEEKS